MSTPPIVIVGAGLAGAKAAEELRAQGHSGGIVLVGDETDQPYDRPPLSKEYLAGKAGREKVFLHPETWYADNNIELLLGTAVSAVDPVEHTVSLSDGSSIAYAKLLLSTGSRPRTLPVPGGDAVGLLYLRKLGDSDRIREVLTRVQRLVIIGAGWIGLEVAAAARNAGVEVTIVETLELPLVRVLGPEIAQVFADLHRSHGVDLRLGASLAEITQVEGRPAGVTLADGTEIAADAVLVGVGAQPNVELAAAAGLEVANGIVVDAGLRTSSPDIYAAGDVANAFHPVLGKRVRVEHWANALNQPAVAAAGMLGQAASYDRPAYFYTDQYDLGMEYVGYVEPGDYDAVAVRGNLASREFIAFWTKGNRVLAAMAVNIWDVVDDLRALITSGSEIAPQLLEDPSVPLSELGAPSA
jgi:3-phenylpropionate/trans-cinnamate dioxygenase ferredoxin reductase subunit